MFIILILNIIVYVLKTGTYREYCEGKSFIFLKKTSETNRASYDLLKIECKTFTKHSYSGRPFTSYHYTVRNKKNSATVVIRI